MRVRRQRHRVLQRGSLSKGEQVAEVVTTLLKRAVQELRGSSGEAPWQLQLTRVLVLASGLSYSGRSEAILSFDDHDSSFRITDIS